MHCVQLKGCAFFIGSILSWPTSLWLPEIRESVYTWSIIAFFGNKDYVHENRKTNNKSLGFILLVVVLCMLLLVALGVYFIGFKGTLFGGHRSICWTSDINYGAPTKGKCREDIEKSTDESSIREGTNDVGMIIEPTNSIRYFKSISSGYLSSPPVKTMVCFRFAQWLAYSLTVLTLTLKSESRHSHRGYQPALSNSTTC